MRVTRNAILALVKKDLVLYFSNRRALIVSIAAPIAIAAFFGSLFGGGGDQAPSRVPIVVIDRDASPISKKIVAALAEDSALEVKTMADAEAADAVKRGKLRAVVTIPAGFAERAPGAMFGRAEKPRIVIQYDPSQGIVLQMIRGLLAAHVMQTVSQNLFSTDGAVEGNNAPSPMDSARADVQKSTTMSEAARGNLLGLFDALDRVRADDATGNAKDGARSTGQARFDLPYELDEKEAVSRPDAKYNGYSHSFAGMGVQFILFMGIDLGVGLLIARRMGLWKRLRAAPISRAALLGSRVASGALIAALLFVIIFAAGIAFFHVRVEGSMLGFAGLIIAFAAMTASFGLFLAAIGNNPETTRGLAIFATLLMVMLGGAWVPSFVFPQWLQTASLVMPTRWAVDGFDAMTWRGLGFEAAWLPIVVLLSFALLFGIAATLRFDWDEK